jgi:CO/xanthine dehydrogenase FAD-binding subunit
MTISFVSAESVEDAVSALRGGARPIAGGTDLVVGARQGKAALPERLVAIHRIEALRGVSSSEAGLRLGALATHREIAGDSTVRSRFTALADASSIVGSEATRTQGTIGGNLMNASPAMEVGGPLQVFGAEAVLRSETGERWVPVSALATGPGSTVATPEELLTEVRIAVPPEGTGSCYARLEYRRQMEIAIVGVTARVTLGNGEVVRARVAITALAPTIELVPEAEQALVGSDGGAAAVDEAAAAAARAARPISDVRGSSGYRRAMAEVVARRVIEAAVRRAGGEEVAVPASDALFGAAGRAP